MTDDAFAIETRGLTKVYSRWFGRRRHLAVDQLDLQVPVGRTFGFLGPNGAGKTTTVKMLLGLVRPTAGEGSVLGEPIGHEQVRRRVGFLPEEPAFANHLKAREFLTYCARLSQVPYAERRERADRMLDVVGLADRATTPLSEFSRGMLERIGIAQALLHDPELLILDEPMTGLDPSGRREVKRIMQRLAQEGRTLFFSSHILSDVEELCDWVGILNQGHLITAGPIDELLGKGGAEILTDELPAEAIEKVTPLVAGMDRDGDRWRLRVDEADHLGPVRSLLEDSGCTDLEIREQRQDLEAYFMRIIEADTQQRKEVAS